MEGHQRFPAKLDGRSELLTDLELRGLGRQIAMGLMYLHGKGIALCDTRPDNLFSKSREATDKGLFYDHTVDIWAYGTTLLHLLTNETLDPLKTGCPVNFKKACKNGTVLTPDTVKLIRFSARKDFEHVLPLDFFKASSSLSSAIETPAAPAGGSTRGRGKGKAQAQAQGGGQAQ
ncbi:hypothetical protein BGX33_011929, partial [Mortierella sp. NVP41]